MSCICVLGVTSHESERPESEQESHVYVCLVYVYVC